MKFYINDREVEAREGQSILDAALEAGIFIPHLCSHPDLEAKGGCRLCVVEIEGKDKPLPACTTMPSEGMRVSVNGPQADKVRRMSMELILATHPADCTGCPKYGKCELQSMYQYMGVSPERWRKKSRSVANDDSNPLIQHLFTRCIRCGRCIRACQDLRGVKVLDYIKTDAGIRAGIPDGKTLKEAGCRFCGACIEVCPTGSIVDQVKIMKEDRKEADNIVPCRATCPANIDIPRFIRHIRNGEYEKASAVIRERMPFPEILGSVCTHPCETECKHKELGSSIAICKLKRAAGVNDTGEWKQRVRKDPDTGKKAAVIGGGPAGLTAPAPAELLQSGYDAVLVSVGTHLGTKLPIPGNDLKNVYVNAAFLRAARMGDPMPVGENVMVLGGGSVAYDCARTALRLGAKNVHIACLENEQQMTASKDEIEEGAEEGIILHAAHSFLKITGEEQAEGVELQKVERFYFDENRRAVIDLVPGSNEIIPAQTVIFAVGQKPEDTAEMGLELTHGPYVKADASLHTSMDGVFAAGDVVTGTKTVIEAVAAGRLAAEQMDLYLGGDGDISEVLLDPETADPYIGHIDGFGDLPRVEPVLADACARAKNFDPVEPAFTCEQAGCEAARCLQCDLRLQLTRPKLWNEY